MKKIKLNPKSYRAREILKNYQTGCTYLSLKEAMVPYAYSPTFIHLKGSYLYKNPSKLKVKAWGAMKRLCKKYEGKNLRVWNNVLRSMLSGFTYTKDGQEYLLYKAKTNAYIIQLN